MKTTTRILSFILIIAFLAACTPAPTALPTATATPAPTATQAQTITPTPEPSLTPTLATPEIAPWMAASWEEDYTFESADTGYKVVTTLTDGTKITVFEQVDGEWQPSYESMSVFITPDGGFRLEEALEHLVIRTGEQDEYKMNQGDYDRFVEETNKIWTEWTGGWTQEEWDANKDKVYIQVLPDSKAGHAFDGYRIKLTCTEDAVEMIRMLGVVRVRKGVYMGAIGTPEGEFPFMVVEGSGYVYMGGDESPERIIEQLAVLRENLVGVDFYFPLDSEDNEAFGGEINRVVREEMRGWIGANQHDGKALREMQADPNQGLEAALAELTEEGPVVLASGYFEVAK